MLTLPAIVLMTWAEWYLRANERLVVYPFDETRIAPLDAGAPEFAEVEVPMADGTRLVLWRHDPPDGRPTILYLPGNAGPLAARAPRLSRLAAAGFGVVAMAYRGSSGSGGTPDETLLSGDALAVFDDLRGPVILYGESLGTALAVRIAAERDALAVVLESPFTSFPDIAAVQFPDIDLRGAMTQIWDTEARMPEVTEPLLVIHGANDRLVPIAQGEAVFAVAGSHDKRLARMPGRGHGGLWPGRAEVPLFRFLDRF